jgi:hypothetical protein
MVMVLTAAETHSGQVRIVVTRSGTPAAKQPADPGTGPGPDSGSGPGFDVVVSRDQALLFAFELIVAASALSVPEVAARFRR